MKPHSKCIQNNKEEAWKKHICMNTKLDNKLPEKASLMD